MHYVEIASIHSRNPRLLHATASMVGLPVRLWVRSGGAFEGVLRCVSPDIDIVLEVVHKVIITCLLSNTHILLSKNHAYKNVVSNFPELLEHRRFF